MTDGKDQTDQPSSGKETLRYWGNMEKDLSSVAWSKNRRSLAEKWCLLGHLFEDVHTAD